MYLVYYAATIFFVEAQTTSHLLLLFLLWAADGGLAELPGNIVLVVYCQLFS